MIILLYEENVICTMIQRKPRKIDVEEIQQWRREVLSKQNSGLAKGNALEEITKDVLENLGFNITLSKAQK